MLLFSFFFFFIKLVGNRNLGFTLVSKYIYLISHNLGFLYNQLSQGGHQFCAISSGSLFGNSYNRQKANHVLDMHTYYVIYIIFYIGCYNTVKEVLIYLCIA